MFLALSAGELANGLAYLFIGIFRLYFMRIGNFYVATYSVECFYRTPWSTLMIFSGQFPALINVFITMERVFALEYATYYRRLWQERYNYYLILLAFLLTAVFIALAITINSINHNRNPTRMCGVMQSTGAIYGTFHFCTISIIYMSCFIVLKVIFNRINKLRVSTGIS
ncbi:hypothetical protein OESDEN_05234 [Oesophagostomum dentatum]|uniref:G-protein coupled receptors family 1 profile domain-containing protein n=1 Tax=Oesophagostomum dentatum TaxID=61180 RepID=A0A0B1TB92_OESDE|nr:hypothetical protein OESDEN_05234 [Oesophagostomum dentatum]